MLRSALVAYLAIATVLGPSLCCCKAPWFFKASGTKSCCTKAIALRTKTQADHAFQSSAQGNSPHDRGNRHECLCQAHRANLVAAKMSSGGSAVFHTAFIPEAAPGCELNGAQDDDSGLASVSPVPPAGLYGQEMLRAYQLMRC